MRALIVGAGAVGQVYGYHLQQAGWQVGFLVRPRYADDARAGFRLYPLNRPHRGAPVLWSDFEVFTSDDEAAEQSWDQVWLAVSTTAIQKPWLPELLAKLGEVAVVSLQPGPEGAARIAEVVPAPQRVFGLIAFIAYQAPLPGEDRFDEPGLAYWLPPSPSPFAGPESAVEPLVAALKKGGCPAAYERGGFDDTASFGSALLQVHVATLESAGWGWADARRGPWLRLARDAWREAAAIAAHDLGKRPPWWTRLVGPLAARVAMFLAPVAIPIDLETYFAYHFTKVGDQTRTHLEHWIAHGQAAGLPTSALSELRRTMDAGASHVGAEAARA